MNGRHFAVVAGLLTLTLVAAGGALAWLGNEGIGPSAAARGVPGPVR